jgi:membrane protease YdiL (CAAX protease family)
MLNLSAYRAHEALVAPARDKAQLWRLVIGIILVSGVALLTSQFIAQTLWTVLGDGLYAALIGQDGRSTQLSVLFLLFSFGLLILGVIVALRVAHNRGLAGVLGDLRLLRHQFLSVLALLIVLQVAIVLLPPYGSGIALEPNVPLSAWVLVLPFSVLAILVQVSAEEIFFRGYLQQQLAARFASPVIWLVVPSVFFAWGHYAPQSAGAHAMHLAVWAGLFGLAMADLTARAGTLGPAIAVHFVNNAQALLFVSLPDSLSGLSLYTLPFDLTDSTMVDDLLPVEYMMILLYWLAARLAMRR